MIPQNTKESIDAYIEQRRPTGGFLRSVLENDLAGACARADMNNAQALFDIVRYIYMKAPSICWGSPERVEEWLRHDC